MIAQTTPFHQKISSTTRQPSSTIPDEPADTGTLSRITGISAKRNAGLGFRGGGSNVPIRHVGFTDIERNVD